MKKKIRALALGFVLASPESVGLHAVGQSAAGTPVGRVGEAAQDERATYDLLGPETSSFRTDYEVSVTTSGATVFFDKIGARLDDASRTRPATASPIS